MQRNLSKKAFQEANKYIPGGVNSPVRALRNVGADPLFIKHADVVELTDLDDNKYIDFCLSWGVFINGHNNIQVRKAVTSALANGTSYGIPNVHETQLAKIICESVPSIEKVRFVNSGTEAVMSAIRLARAYTQRDLIIKFDGCYHGHADYLLVSAGSGVANLTSASSIGVPKDFINHTISLPYNDIDAVQKVFNDFGCTIAAVIIEPVAANMGVVVPDKAFLLQLRGLTSQFGSLLIFDEVITGFRNSIGGAQEQFGINPDLTTLGKIIGGGFPVGAYGGSAKIMSLIAPEGPVYQAGTLSGNPIAMAAGIKTLEMISNDGFYARQKDIAIYFYNKLEKIIENKGMVLNTCGSMFTLFFSDRPIRNFADVNACDTQKFGNFFRALLDQGVYLSPSQFEANFISSVHSKKILDTTLESIYAALSLC
jgi:glutamate-1-semialdehyde 2,1-aminomutase